MTLTASQLIFFISFFLLQSLTAVSAVFPITLCHLSTMSAGSAGNGIERIGKVIAGDGINSKSNKQ
jgi:hypothetical protein